MLNAFEGREHPLINILGHAAGMLVFGNFLFLLLWHRPGTRAYTSRLAVLAAALALIWNLASLTAILAADEGKLAGRIIAAVAFCALSLLPAVLLDLCLFERLRWAVRAGYVLSGAAMIAHGVEVVRGAAVYHRFGLMLITAGFGLLTVTAVLRILWSGEADQRLTSSRLFAAMSLFLFAISFVHFSEGESHRAWTSELAFHHTGIPLALFILIQDYRFVFLDAFIRFLANGALAALFGTALMIGSASLSSPLQVLAASLAFSFFALARGAVLQYLGKIVFNEVDVDGVIVRLAGLPAKSASEDEYVRTAFQTIADVMNTHVVDVPAQNVTLQPLTPMLAGQLPESRELRRKGADVIVPIRRSYALPIVMFLGARRSGRRYLSRDLEALARLANYIGQETDRMHETEMHRLHSEAELRALQAQIHPHFLFNALNTLYGIIPRQAKGARDMLLNLSEILRYFLGLERTYIPIEEELRIATAYLSIEELRLGSKLRTRIEVEDELARQLIPALCLEPLVENAVKHGIAPRPEGGEVRIEVRRESDGMRIVVHDTGRGFKPGAKSAEHMGIGLKNVSRRLELCYGPESALEIQTSELGSTVGFWAPLNIRDVREVRLSQKMARR